MSSLYGGTKVEIITVTHRGMWKVTDDIEIECYVTDDKRRLMSLRGTARAMGLKNNNSRALLRNLQSKWMEPYLPHQLEDWINRASEDKLSRIEAKSAPAPSKPKLDKAVTTAVEKPDLKPKPESAKPVAVAETSSTDVTQDS